jgi:hypothetical protein
MSLLVTCTLDGWNPILENAMAAPFVKGIQPVPRSNESASIFFILFIVFSVFVMLNLFVGAQQFTQVSDDYLIKASCSCTYKSLWGVCI